MDGFDQPQVLVRSSKGHVYQEKRERPFLQRRKVKPFSVHSQCIRSYNSDGSLMTLQQCCLNFVAANVDLVDSFDGFPEDFAKLIFFKAIKKFEHSDWSTIAHLFCSAFSPNFLTDINVNNQIFLDKFELGLKATFNHVVRIEVADCAIDDNHDLLKDIIAMDCLQYCLFTNNFLTTKALKQMTMPCLFKTNGFKSLEYLNIAQDIIPVPDMSHLQCLSLMPKLKIFHCHGIVLRDGTLLPNLVKNRFALKIDKCRSFQPVSTKGWGSCMIQQWLKAAGHVQKNFTTQRKSFYGSQNKTKPLPKPHLFSHTESGNHVQVLKCVIYEKKAEESSPYPPSKRIRRSIPGQENDLDLMYFYANKQDE